MRVVETSAWIEWQSRSALGQKLAVEMSPDREWLVPTVVQFELMRWALPELSRERVETVIGRSNTIVVQGLVSGLYATTMKFGADLLTCDAHFANLPHVYFPKGAP